MRVTAVSLLTNVSCFIYPSAFVLHLSTFGMIPFDLIKNKNV